MYLYGGCRLSRLNCFFFQAEDGIRDADVTGVQTCALPIFSHAVWAAEGPLAVDADSWTLVLWAAQDRGLRWHATSSDGGGAMATALGVVDPEGQHGRDAWHVLRRCAQVQGRLDRWVAESTEQTAAGARQAARGAAGQRPRSDVAAHAAEGAPATAVATGVRYRSNVLRALLEGA